MHHRAGLLDAEVIDSTRALQLFDRVTALEARIKRVQLELWLRSNSALTPAQRALLASTPKLLQLPEWSVKSGNKHW